MRHLITVIGNIGGDYKEGFGNDKSQCYTNTIFESQGKDKEGNDKKPLCFPFSVWDKRAETLKKWAPKGTLIALELEVSSKYSKGSDDNNEKLYTNFTCTGFKFISNKGNSEETQEEPKIVENSKYHGDDKILWD